MYIYLAFLNMIYNYLYYSQKLNFSLLFEKKKQLNIFFFVIYSIFMYKNICFIIYSIPLY